MEIVVRNKVIIQGAPATFRRSLKEKLTFSNPAYDQAKKYGRSTWRIEKEIRCYERAGTDLIILRGFIGHLLRLAGQMNVRFRIIDQTRMMPEVPLTFAGDLRDYQDEAVQDVLAHDIGVLNAPTGSGKTTMALAIIAARKQPALVIVHSKELLQQWKERACQFLNLKTDEIGQIGGGKKKIGGRLTLGIVNSIYPIASDIRDKFGFIIVDECHHCPSRIFTEAVSAFDSKFMLGLSATPYRRDKLTKLIYWHLGDKVHEVDKSRLIQEGSILQPEIVIKETGFISEYNLTEDYSKGISELTMDGPRNSLIVSDVTEYLRNNDGPALVLTDRKVHCEMLADMLTDLGIKAALLTGDLPRVKREETVRDIRAGKVRAIVATGSLVGEGFDLPALSALFLATPIKYRGRVTQYVGRVLRPAPGKDRALIFDYLDEYEPVLMASARSRQLAYDESAQNAP